MKTPAPLWAPQPGASFGQAVSRFFKKYATFSGRASRSEVWWVVLMNVLVQLVFFIIIGIGFATSGETILVENVDELTEITTGGGPVVVVASFLFVLWGLILIVPSLALGARRLHDVNMSALWLLLLITGIGGIFMLIISLLPSNPMGARFDQPPFGYEAPQPHVYGQQPY